MIIFRWILLRMRNISDKSCRENRVTHLNFSNCFLKSSCLWDVESYCRGRQGTDGSILRRTRFACWITKARHTDTPTLRICDTYCFSTATMVTRPRLGVMLYVPCLSCSKPQWSELTSHVCGGYCCGLLQLCGSTGQLFLRGFCFCYPQLRKWHSLKAVDIERSSFTISYFKVTKILKRYYWKACRYTV